MLEIGTKAPEFVGTDENGKEVSLNDFKGHKLVLYFYPKDSTPGCTAEAQFSLVSWARFFQVLRSLLLKSE